jgi:hypothetical protein
MLRAEFGQFSVDLLKSEFGAAFNVFRHRVCPSVVSDPIDEHGATI